MRLLEYEAKNILKQYGIPVPKSILVDSTSQISLEGPLVLKAQIPTGGRKKSGGIIHARSRDEAKNGVEHLLSSFIRGYKSKMVLIEEELGLTQEIFIAVTYDTVVKRPIAIFSSFGGIDVEELAAREPEKVVKEYFSVRERLPQFKARAIIADAGISGRDLLALGSILSRLVDLFLDYDATLAEINPLAKTKDGKFVALDCHLEIDDDALPRHKDIMELGNRRDLFEGGRTVTEFEAKAAEIDSLDHRGVAGRVIEFDGELGLIIGGGGASLTAFDAVKFHGGSPANYCEIGGNPSVRKVKELTKHILSKPGVKKIAVIMNVVSNTRVDLVARGVVKGILEAGRIPSETVAVFRVPGAWEEEGFKILSQYGVPFYGRNCSIDEAAKIAVEKTKNQF